MRWAAFASDARDCGGGTAALISRTNKVSLFV